MIIPYLIGIMVILALWCIVLSVHLLQAREQISRLDEIVAEHFEKVHGDVYTKKGTLR